MKYVRSFKMTKSQKVFSISSNARKRNEQKKFLTTYSKVSIIRPGRFRLLEFEKKKIVLVV